MAADGNWPTTIQKRQDDDEQTTESEDLLDDGDVIGGRFVIVEELQSGSFGQVYLSLDNEFGEREVALKVEKPCPAGKRSFCMHEVNILRTCQGMKHVPEMYAYSVSPPVQYIAMQLMSFTLTELRRSCPSRKRGHFSLSTTIRIGRQCLAAAGELHSVGIVHRDIKPTNYMMGASERTKRTVYLLDFGLSRFYRNAKGELLPPREKPGFVGSTRYASPNAHEGRELGRHDDLWSLLYVIVEMRNGILPWRNVGDRHVVGAVKKSTPFEAICRHLPSKIQKFGRMLETLSYHDEPDYAKLDEVLLSIAEENQIVEDEPFDWEENWTTVMREDSDMPKPPPT